MLRFLSGVAIVVFATFCGYLLSKKYRQKKVFFQQFKEFNERFLSEITYYRRPIQEFVSGYRYQGEFQVLLEEFFSTMETRAANDQKVFNLPEYHFLTAEEKVFVIDYFSMLGKGDSLSQKGYFSSVKETLAKLQMESEKDCKRYGDLYVKIGFLCGLLILILIV